jgi:two-component system sensor histidine kinase CpxA
VVDEQEVDLPALVAEVVRDAEYEAAERQRHVAIVGTASAVVRGSAEVLRRAVENVVRNAAQFTQEGTTVEVRLVREQSDGAARVRLEVLDRGPGVPDEALRDIFLPFYRVGSARDRRTGGSGIGLAIVDRGIRLHGGRVEAANREGGGLVVTIELPVA